MLGEQLAQQATVRGHIHECASAMRESHTWNYWPTEEDVLLDLTDTISEHAATAAQTDASELRRLLRWADGRNNFDEEVRQSAAAQLGVILVNAPEVADWLGCELNHLEAIAKARTKLLREREEIAPGTTPLATPNAVIGKAMERVEVLWYRWNASRIPVNQSVCHAPSASLAADLTSKCSVLSESLSEQRAAEKSVAARRRLHARLEKSAPVKVSVVNGKLKRGICDECRPQIDRLIEDQLRSMPSVRPGWWVDYPSGTWRCEVHGRTETCGDCPSFV